jgi:TonB family protein
VRLLRGTVFMLGVAAQAFTQDSGAPALEKLGPGVTAPTIRKKVEPEYSEEARKARYEGRVSMAIVVRSDGKIGDVQVIRPLGKGLDEQAIKAVRKWRFNPAMKEGQPVAVQVVVEMNFSLFNGPRLPAALAAALANPSEPAVTIKFKVNGSGMVLPSSIVVENAESLELINQIKVQVRDWQFKPVAGGMPLPANLEFRIDPKKLVASGSKAQ